MQSEVRATVVGMDIEGKGRSGGFLLNLFTAQPSLYENILSCRCGVVPLSFSLFEEIIHRLSHQLLVKDILYLSIY